MNQTKYIRENTYQDKSFSNLYIHCRFPIKLENQNLFISNGKFNSIITQ